MYPEHRQLAEENVADGAAAHAGHRGQQRETEDVHLLARGDQGAGCGEDGDAEPIEELDKRRHVPACS